MKAVLKLGKFSRIELARFIIEESGRIWLSQIRSKTEIGARDFYEPKKRNSIGTRNCYEYKPPIIKTPKLDLMKGGGSGEDGGREWELVKLLTIWSG